MSRSNTFLNGGSSYATVQTRGVQCFERALDDFFSMTSGFSTLKYYGRSRGLTKFEQTGGSLLESSGGGQNRNGRAFSPEILRCEVPTAIRWFRHLNVLSLQKKSGRSATSSTFTTLPRSKVKLFGSFGHMVWPGEVQSSDRSRF